MSGAEVEGARERKESAFIVTNPTYAKVREVPVPVEAHLEYRGESGENLFPNAYGSVATRPVPMDERNVYCGAYHVTTLLKAEDKGRVVAYNGGELMAVGCSDSRVDLMNVYSDDVRSFIRGHCGRIRAIILCRNRKLLISASSNHCVVCWDLKTGAFLHVFSGHIDAVTCMDLHKDTLVSGSRDCRVKVWSLAMKSFKHLKFQHPSPVLCVKLVEKVVISSCHRQVRMWNIEKASLLKVIDGHQSAVKCLFMDSYHVLTGDRDGQVMAWSTSAHVDGCLMSFARHPSEVSSVALCYLRVITGCADGRVRIFCLLTGCCIRSIQTDSPVLSVHTQESVMVANTRAGVLLYEFEEVKWAYFATSKAFVLDVPGTSFTQSILKYRRSGDGSSAWYHPLEGVTASRTQDIYSRYLQKPFPRLSKQNFGIGRAPVFQQTNLGSHIFPQRAQAQTPTVGKSSEPLHLCYGSPKFHLPPLAKPVACDIPTPGVLQPEDRGSKNMNQHAEKDSKLEGSLPDLKEGTLPNTAETPQAQSPVLKPIGRQDGKNFSSQQHRSCETQAPTSIAGQNPEHLQICYGKPETQLPPLSMPAPSTVPSPGVLQSNDRAGDQQVPMLWKPFGRQHAKHVHFTKPSPLTVKAYISNPLREGVSFWPLTETEIQERVRSLAQTSPDKRNKATKKARDKQRNMLWQMKMKGVSITHLLDLDGAPAPELGKDTYI